MTLSTYLQLINTELSHRTKTMSGMDIADKYRQLHGKPKRKKENEWKVNDYPVEFLQDHGYAIIMKHLSGRTAS